MAVPAASHLFATTHWSVVLAAGDGAAPGSDKALSLLCQSYWFPLYAHIRRRGHDAESARDLTQGFFAQLLSRNTIAQADRERGRFRTFLLAALDCFLRQDYRDAQALKRGGGREILSLDALEAENRLAAEPTDDRSPEREFDRRWALATLERAQQRMRQEFSLSGKVELFDRLRPHLLNDGMGAPYAQMGAELNMTVVAVKVTVHRLRRRYGEVLREEIAQTLADRADVDAELRHLIESLS